MRTDCSHLLIGLLTRDVDAQQRRCAEAGFFYTPESNSPDLVQCFYCDKELDGWDPNDDPWEEHKSHSSKCPYLKMEDMSDMTLLTMQDQMKLLQAKHSLMMKETITKKKQLFLEHAKGARDQMHELINK
eukprot:GHVO01011329.1.p1 GENE.GHVO01011329.1~~GHVO01011329.1.p1  ORF type:complete len:130 (+),score=22.61 GHVO01011329.1:132-521(+)